jgi:hypothetical protein
LISLTDDSWLLNRFRIGVAIKPVDWLKIYAQGKTHGTTRVRPITPSANGCVGAEIDLVATYQPVKFLTFLAGYSHFFAGDYLADTGPSEDADFGYAQAPLSF